MKHTKIVLTVSLTLCILVLLLGILPIHGESEIYNSVLRLHVIANSDSAEDQARKLRVRDAVLEAAQPLLASCKTREEAMQAVQEHLPLMEDAARSVLLAEGCNDTVTASLGEEIYPTKNYESFCFPSGNYLSLQIKIGNADGQNWWCVLFPPMCFSAASKESAEDACISVGLTGEQYRIITETDRPAYTARFRILEVIEEATRR